MTCPLLKHLDVSLDGVNWSADCPVESLGHFPYARLRTSDGKTVMIKKPDKASQTEEDEKIKEILNCELGLYRVHWKESQGGRSSLAAVGNDRNGDRWFAPMNWVSGSAKLKDHVHWIERMERIV